jgi:hypothetical protein
MRLMTGVDDARKPASRSPAGLLTRPLRPYAEIFEIPGAWRFSTAAIIGRMPMSMFGLGTVLLISAVTGKYGVAGAVSAAGSGRWTGRLRPGARVSQDLGGYPGFLAYSLARASTSATYQFAWL